MGITKSWWDAGQGLEAESSKLKGNKDE